MTTSDSLRGWAHIKSILRPWYRTLKYKLRLRFQPRKNQIYSQFYRFPHQYRVLREEVLPAQGFPAGTDSAEKLNVLMFGTCHGDELYSLSSELHAHSPRLSYDIRAFELVEELVTKTRSAAYTEEEVRFGAFVDDAFIDRTFDRADDQVPLYRVKPHLVRPTYCAQGDILDSTFMEQLAPAHLVFAQNLLFHLPRNRVASAFENLCRLVSPGGYLFINGMDTDVRIRLTKRLGLEPVATLVEEIHEDARVDRGDSWAGYYFGREPFSRRSKDWLRKYATIFRRTEH